MSNKLKKSIKNKWVEVEGIHQTPNGNIITTTLNCIITNDEVGKTLSIVTQHGMFTFAFERIEKYLK